MRQGPLLMLDLIYIQNSGFKPDPWFLDLAVAKSLQSTRMVTDADADDDADDDDV